jgi:hypothetical protein
VQRRESMKTRFDADSWAYFRWQANSIISEIYHLKKSYEEFEQMKESLIHKHPAWERLPARYKAELAGFFQGAVQAWYECALVWCHELNGELITASDFCRRDLPLADVEKSFHVWRGTKKKFKT